MTSFMNVPSPFQMEYASEQEKVLDDEGGWVDTHHYADKDSLGDKISEMNLEDAASSSPGLCRPLKYLFFCTYLFESIVNLFVWTFRSIY